MIRGSVRALGLRWISFKCSEWPLPTHAHAVKGEKKKKKKKRTLDEEFHLSYLAAKEASCFNIKIDIKKQLGSWVLWTNANTALQECSADMG